jgi:hypothetical protein
MAQSKSKSTKTKEKSIKDDPTEEKSIEDDPKVSGASGAEPKRALRSHTVGPLVLEAASDAQPLFFHLFRNNSEPQDITTVHVHGNVCIVTLATNDKCQVEAQAAKVADIINDSGNGVITAQVIGDKKALVPATSQIRI